ncbi:hypothetical protein M0R04_15425 [Candidatus Dojkabacteria bacterium]|nr:hypothetical protein [Candidatus Dojkabacteria bacterium]
MKQYIIKKIAYADSINQLEDMFPGGETVYIECLEEIKNSDQLGFKKTYGETSRDKN